RRRTACARSGSPTTGPRCASSASSPPTAPARPTRGPSAWPGPAASRATASPRRATSWRGPGSSTPWWRAWPGATCRSPSGSSRRWPLRRRPAGTPAAVSRPPCWWWARARATPGSPTAGSTCASTTIPPRWPSWAGPWPCTGSTSTSPRRRRGGSRRRTCAGCRASSSPRGTSRARPAARGTRPRNGRSRPSTGSRTWRSVGSEVRPSTRSPGSTCERGSEARPHEERAAGLGPHGLDLPEHALQLPAVELVRVGVRAGLRRRLLGRAALHGELDGQHLGRDGVAVLLEGGVQLAGGAQLQGDAVADLEPRLLAGVLDEPDHVARQALEPELGRDLGPEGGQVAALLLGRVPLGAAGVEEQVLGPQLERLALDLEHRRPALAHVRGDLAAVDPRQRGAQRGQHAAEALAEAGEVRLDLVVDEVVGDVQEPHRLDVELLRDLVGEEAHALELGLVAHAHQDLAEGLAQLDAGGGARRAPELDDARQGPHGRDERGVLEPRVGLRPSGEVHARLRLGVDGEREVAVDLLGGERRHRGHQLRGRDEGLVERRV